MFYIIFVIYQNQNKYNKKADIAMIQNLDKNKTQIGKSVVKWNTFLIIIKVRRQLNFGNNPLPAKAKKYVLILLH